MNKTLHTEPGFPLGAGDEITLQESQTPALLYPWGAIFPCWSPRTTAVWLLR